MRKAILRLNRSVVFCVLVTFALPTFAQQSAQLPSAPEPWVKAESSVIVVLELARFWSGPEKDRLHEISNLHPFVSSWALRDAEAMSGLSPTEVARLTVSEEWPTGWAVAVETLEPAQADRLRGKLVQDAEAAEAHRRQFFSNDRLSLHPLEASTALIALPPDVMQPILARLDAEPAKMVSLPPISGAKPALLDVYLRPAGMSGAFDNGTPPALVALSKANHVRVAFEPASGLLVRFLAQFPDEAAAQAGADSLTPLLSQLEKYLEMCELNMPTAVQRFATENPGAEKLGPLLDRAIKAARQGVTSAKVEREGKAVAVVISIETSQPATDAVLLLSLLPRASK